MASCLYSFIAERFYLHCIGPTSHEQTKGSRLYHSTHPRRQRVRSLLERTRRLVWPLCFPRVTRYGLST